MTSPRHAFGPMTVKVHANIADNHLQCACHAANTDILLDSGDFTLAARNIIDSIFSR